jgi:hypothetical protein
MSDQEPTVVERQWAEHMFNTVEPTEKAVKEFDASPDGARYKKITGISMWTNLGGDNSGLP